MRIVLDTNILVRANSRASPQGLARDLLLTIVTGPHTLLLSRHILAEVQRVLAYPRVQVRWPLTHESIEQYVISLEAAGLLVEVPGHIPAILTDPDDDPILQTAVEGRADVLCSRDEAFQHRLVTEYCRARGIRILNDAELMQELRQARR